MEGEWPQVLYSWLSPTLLGRPCWELCTTANVSIEYNEHGGRKFTVKLSSLGSVEVWLGTMVPLAVDAGSSV